MKYLSILVCFLIANFSFSQVIPISDEGSVDLPCEGGLISLTDSDADGGNYLPGEMYTITICPDDGNYLEFNATPEAGGSFELESGDFLFIYDGEDSSAPLIGSYGDDIDPSIGLTANSTFDNPSGCLTLVFVSGTSSLGAPGFLGVVTCAVLPLPFEVTITGDPVDIDGYIDICQGDSVVLFANTNYLYSGQGYDQSDATSNFLWEFPDGSVFEGIGLTELPPQIFTESYGSLILLTVTDNAGGGIYSESAEIKIRVSTTPDFSGLIAQYNDTICLGETATLVGGITPDTTQTFGVQAQEGAFIGGGVFGDQLFLPDGTGDTYETTINIDDFSDGVEISSSDDIVAICVTIEHSFLGDLEMWLECPDGTQVTLFDTHVNTDTVFNTTCGGSEGFLDGGWCPGGVDLGIVGDGSEPGEGFEYCFTPGAILPPMGSEQPMESPVPAGDYQPEGDFSELIGCDINGDWTLVIADNWGGDDGWVFNWSIVFNPLIDPNAEFYTPVLTDAFWDDDSDIVSEQSNDTLIVVNPPVLGEHCYTFNVSDNFGCDYDTTVCLTVIPNIAVTALDPGCFLSSELTVSESYLGGFWTAEGPTEESPFPLLPIGSGEILAFEPGDYTLTYQDFFCQSEQSVDIYFPPTPIADITPDSLIICYGFGDELSSLPQPDGLPVSYLWQYDSLGFDPIQSLVSFVEVTQPGLYTLSVTDAICNITVIDLITVEAEICEIEVFNVFSPNGDGSNDFFYIEAIDKFVDPMVYVYNRWGNLIFEKKNYQNNWDMDGLVEGTYYYVVQNPQKNETFKGHFTLVR